MIAFDLNPFIYYILIHVILNRSSKRLLESKQLHMEDTVAAEATESAIAKTYDTISFKWIS